MVFCASSAPISSGRSPPTSCDSDSFPSEKAPAPLNPVVMRHGWQPTQWPTFSLGQLRRSMGRPFSTMVIWRPSPRASSERAQKMPAGPAPMIKTSVAWGIVSLPVMAFPFVTHRDAYVLCANSLTACHACGTSTPPSSCAGTHIFWALIVSPQALRGRRVVLNGHNR